MKGNGVNCLRIFRESSLSVCLLHVDERERPDLTSRFRLSTFKAYSAVQFTTYETLKSVFTDYEDGQAGGKGKGKLGTGLKLVAGSLAGITSVRRTLVSSFALELHENH